MPPNAVAQAEVSSLPKGPDISHEVMGELLIADGVRIARELSPQAGDPRAAVEELARTAGLDPAVTRVLDLSRPAAIAMLNPSLLASATVRPYVAMLPVTSRADVERLLSSRGPVEKQPWGVTLATTAGRVHIGFQRGYAVIAWREDLLAPAVALLSPRLAQRADAPVVLHLDVENLYAAYGPQLEAMVSQVAQLAARSNDPQLAFAMRGVRDLSRYTKSCNGLDVLADLDSGGLTLTVRLDGKKDGAWAGYVRQQRPGPAWGVRFLPRDSVLVYTTTASPVGREQDIDASVDYLAGAMPRSKRDDNAKDRWKKALHRAAASTGGELAYAVWPARGGGVGLGGAYKLSDPGMARDAIMAAYDEVAVPLVGVVLRALTLDPARFGSRVQVKKTRAQLSGLDIDLVEVAVKWPVGAEAERRVFESLFGPKLVLATAFVGDQGLFTVGADYAERLSTMIGVARGQPAASLGDEPDFAEALSFHDRARVSMTYLETGRMARFAANIMSQTQELDPRQRAAVGTLLGDVGRGAIVSTTNVSGSRYELTTHLPPAAVVGAAKLNGVMWRIALSPLFNPPMMPPLPVPPPHVTPSVSAPAGPTL